MSLTATGPTLTAPESKGSSNEKTLVFKDVNETVYVNAKNVNLRKNPMMESEVIKKLKKGEKLTRIGVHEEWSKIIYNNNLAYISTPYLSSIAAEEADISDPKLIKEIPIRLDPSWTYALNAKITSGTAMLYKADTKRKNITICLNAGHGTKGGEALKVLSHPDATPRVTGGEGEEGETSEAAISPGITFLDGSSEAEATLKLANMLKTEFLSRGYDVLMIRGGEDVQLDNIARAVIANNTSNCHISLHWDSTDTNKGAFYMGVPEVPAYRAMEPVASNWKKHEALGENLIKGLKAEGIKIFSEGRLPMDLIQTSYSTIASVDLELGDRASTNSKEEMKKMVKGIADGVDSYFGQ
ncbi:MAG: N-acetylmuramoyl-L-alanine amidase [Johnsonella sp.]|nr:N-acetylmuramoyl-L-alanine amidase [Johnsonella sp.]